jgi:hypothetical protein
MRYCPTQVHAETGELWAMLHNLGPSKLVAIDRLRGAVRVTHENVGTSVCAPLHPAPP